MMIDKTRGAATGAETDRSEAPPAETAPPVIEDRAQREQRIMGSRLRAYRRREQLTLKDVGERTSLSESFLSQLERGKASASVSSLQRLTAALGVTVADLFEKSNSVEAAMLLRRNDRPGLPFGKLGRKYLLTPQSQKHLEIFVANFEAGGSTGDDAYSHGASEEFFYVLSGRFEVQVDSTVSLLGPGDSLLYNSSSIHRAVNIGGESGEVMWVISPPSY